MKFVLSTSNKMSECVCVCGVGGVVRGLEGTIATKITTCEIDWLVGRKMFMYMYFVMCMFGLNCKCMSSHAPLIYPRPKIILWCGYKKYFTLTYIVQ